MGLRFIYGRSGTGKSEYCFNEISKIIDGPNKIYIITPEQFSFTAEKKLLEVVNRKAVINAEVLTFNRMAYRVINEAGKDEKQPISDSGKAMIIYDIIEKKLSELKFMGKNYQNIEVASKIITELKKHNIKVSDILNARNDITDIYLQTKLNDIYIIYSEFENQIQNKFLDENDLLTILARKLDEVETFKNTVIYIDEFIGFTTQEYNVIKKLIEQAEQVNITICTDSLEETQNKDSDIFYANKKTVQRLLKLVKKQEIEEPVFMENIYRFKTDELKHLEKNIFKMPYEVYNNKVDNINLFLALNQYSEIEHAASEILKLVRDNNYRYKEISVITKNIGIYSSLIKAIFAKYNIPVFIDEKKQLNQNILVKYIIAILDVFSKNWSFESVINYVKIGFCSISQEEIFILENYCKKYGIKYSKWYVKDWDFGEEDSEKLNHLNDIRRIVVNPLLELKNNFTKLKNAKEICRNIYEFLEKNNIKNQLLQKAEDNPELLEEYILCWNIVIKILDEITNIFNEETINFEKFLKLIKIAFSENGLGRIPSYNDQVIVGDIDRTKTHKVKALFIIGLNDGLFTNINKDEGFIDDLDRESIKKYGIELASTTIEKIYENNFNIYKVFTASEEKLYLSYSSSNSDGTSLKPSEYITKIKKIFKLIEEKSDIIKKEDLITNKESTFEELLLNIRKFEDGVEISPLWFEVYNIYKNNENWNIKLQHAIQALSRTNTPENLDRENIQKLYGDILKTSISKLEQYKKCPFSYYLKYGLKLDDKNTFKIEALDTGTFMHEIIDEFFCIVEEREISIKEISENQVREIIDEIINEKLQLNKNYIFTSTAKYKILSSRLKKLINKSMKYIIETLKQSDFEVFGTEIEFKSGKDYSPIVINTADGSKIEITGKIDRVDIAENQDGKFLRIIDYKSSIKDIDLNDIMYGIQIQLITYLDVISRKEKTTPAGILYFNLIEPVIKANKNIKEEELENEIRKQFKMKGLILADVKVAKMMDKNLEKGYSKIIPAYIDSNDNISQKLSSSITKEQFEILQKYVIKTIKEISKEILNGKIDIKPYYKNKKTACEFCSYKSICKFDSNNKDNNYNYLTKLKDEEIWEKIKEGENS